MVRSGRRPGTTNTREAILDAARGVFHSEGYKGATIRGIAAAAGVDGALVHHYFGSKRGLFVTAMQLPMDPQVVVQMLLASDRDDLGESIARVILDAWESTDTSPFVALIRSAMADEDSARMLRDLIAEEVIGPIAAHLGTDQPRLRAALVGSQMAGLAMLRYIIRLEPVAKAGRDELVEAIGPTLQRYLTAPLWDAPGL